jgi:hypothetical protein
MHLLRGAEKGRLVAHLLPTIVSYVCMHAYVCVCFMYVWMCIRAHATRGLGGTICSISPACDCLVCMHGWMHICMYYMDVCVCTYTHTHIFVQQAINKRCYQTSTKLHTYTHAYTHCLQVRSSTSDATRPLHSPQLLKKRVPTAAFTVDTSQTSPLTTLKLKSSANTRECAKKYGSV